MPPLSYFFWITIFIWFVLGPGYHFVVESPNPRVIWGVHFVEMILIIMLGLKVFA